MYACRRGGTIVQEQDNLQVSGRRISSRRSSNGGSDGKDHATDVVGVEEVPDLAATSSVKKLSETVSSAMKSTGKVDSIGTAQEQMFCWSSLWRQ